jgi:hypothetical protein
LRKIWKIKIVIFVVLALIIITGGIFTIFFPAAIFIALIIDVILFALSFLIEPKLEEIEKKDKAVKEKTEKSVKDKSDISTFEDIEYILANSHPKDWLYDDENGIYTYRLNVDLNLNIRDNVRGNRDKFEEDWVENFSNPNATKVIVRVFHRGSFVKEFLFVYVDGYRNILPLPRTSTDLTISKFKYNFGRILNCKLTSNLEYTLKEYDIKLRMAGIQVREND